MGVGGWISPWWQAACLPDRWDVCGIVVPPLSVWHTFALESIGNAYLCGGPISPDDIALLLLVALHDCRSCKRLMLSERYRSKRQAWVWRHIRSKDYSAAADACQDYVETCMRATSRWQKGTGGKPCAAPYQWHLVRRICSDYGFRADEAWNMPYALARCYFDAAAEADGDESLMTVRAQQMEDEWPVTRPAEAGKN